jgi:peptide/nickel transport system substrate-binding protein
MGLSLCRRLLCLFVAAIACSTLPGCAKTQAPYSPHILRIAYAGDPGSLVPFLAIDQDVIALEGLFCQTLVGLSGENRDIPLLVTRVPSRANGDVSPDGTRITYHLRRDIRFADGVPFTSADVLFTYHAIFDPRNHATLVEPYRRIASIKAPDRYTVVVQLHRPWNAAVRVLFAESDYPYGILPKHAFQDTKVVGTPWESAPFGTGPFRVASWRRSDRIILEPNRYYEPRPKLRQVVVQIIPNLNSNFLALESHSADIAELTPDNFQRAERIPGVRVVRFPENGTGFLYMQTQLPPTNELAVRTAIANAVDLNELSNAWRHAYPIAASFLPPPVITWKNTRIPPYRHDVALANRELDEAGWRMRDGVRSKGSITLGGVIGANSENPISVRIATVIQSQLTAVGMRFTVKTNPTTTWFSYSGLLRNGKAAIVSESWVGGSDPEQSLNLRCAEATPGGSNHSFYCSKQFDTLFEDQTRAPTESARQRDFDAMQWLVHRDVPVLPLYYEFYLQGVDRRVVNYELNMLRMPVNAELWDTL